MLSTAKSRAARIGELLLDQAEGGDRLAEGLTLLGVADGVTQRGARRAHTGGAQLEAANVENVEGDVVALADFAQQILNRHLAVGEHQRAGGGAANTQLVLFRADGEPGSSLLDQERSELFSVDFDEDGEQVGKAGIADPHLLAVENVMRAVRRERGAGTNVHGVRAGGRFGESIGTDTISGGQAGQELLLLRVGAIPDDRQSADAHMRAEGDGEAAQLRQMIGDDGGGDLVHGQAAVSLRDIDRHEAKIARPFSARPGSRRSAWPQSRRPREAPRCGQTRRRCAQSDAALR